MKDQAKTKRCCGPLALISAMFGLEMIKAQVTTEIINPNCVAAECMAWRKTAGSRNSYCGLAGKP